MTIDASDSSVPALATPAESEASEVSLITAVGYKRGLHGVPSMIFTDIVREYVGEDMNKEVSLTYLGRRANGKSIIEVMSLGAPTGADVEISVRGSNALGFAQGLAKLINEGKGLD